CPTSPCAGASDGDRRLGLNSPVAGPPPRLSQIATRFLAPPRQGPPHDRQAPRKGGYPHARRRTSPTRAPTRRPTPRGPPRKHPASRSGSSATMRRGGASCPVRIPEAEETTRCATLMRLLSP